MAQAKASGFMSMSASPKDRVLLARMTWNWAIVQGWKALRDDKRLPLKQRMNAYSHMVNASKNFHADARIWLGAEPKSLDNRRTDAFLFKHSYPRSLWCDLRLWS